MCHSTAAPSVRAWSQSRGGKSPRRSAQYVETACLVTDTAGVCGGLGPFADLMLLCLQVEGNQRGLTMTATDTTFLLRALIPFQTGVPQGVKSKTHGFGAQTDWAIWG